MNNEVCEPIVIITGADRPAGLTTARSLKGNGYELWGIMTSMDQFAAQSNCWDLLELFSNDRSTWLSSLENLSGRARMKSRKKPLLLFSQDEWVLWGASVRDELSKMVEISLPDNKCLHTMMDKTLFHSWALENDVSVPLSIVTTNKDELQEATTKMKFPYIIKPLVRLPSWDNKFVNQKCLEIHSDIELAKYSTEFSTIFQFSEKLLVQQWIPGKDCDVYFVLFAVDMVGNILGSFCGRKIYQWPRLVGSTSVCVSHQSDFLLEDAARVVHLSGMKGLCSVEYKFDIRTNCYYVTEPTIGRNDYQSFIAVTAGANLSLLLANSIFYPEKTLIKPVLVKSIWFDELSFLRVVKSEGLSSIFILFSLLKYTGWRLSTLIWGKGDAKPLKSALRKYIRRK